MYAKDKIQVCPSVICIEIKLLNTKMDAPISDKKMF
jgi:hypothetical protein